FGRGRAHVSDRLANRVSRAAIFSMSNGAAAMKDPLDFSGKVVLVTGSSRGIGAEMIRVFGKRGAHCVVNYVADAQGQNKADAASVTTGVTDPLVTGSD